MLPASTVVIAEVALPDPHHRRLAELGVRAGATARVLQRTVGGGLVLRVEGCRIAVDRATAATITVERSE